jgi:hypothetical protein
MKKNLILSLGIAFCTVLCVGCTTKTVSSQDGTDIIEQTQERNETESVSPVITYSSDKKDYELLNLEIGDSEEEVLKTYGEPNGKEYAVAGTYGITSQRLYTYMLYDDKTILLQKFFDETEGNTNNCIVEMEVSGTDYTTSRGIKVGDSLNDVVNAYDIDYVYPYGEQEGMIAQMIYERKQMTGRYARQNHFYDYGDVEKIAYVLCDKKSSNIPALIFLFQNDKVTRIIVTDTIMTDSE